MKLFVKFNRINLAAMVLVFMLSGIMYYLVLSRVLIQELDEALDEYRSRVSAFVIEHKRLPEFNSFDEVEVNYHLTNKSGYNKFNSVDRFDQEEKANRTFRQLIFTQEVKGQLYEINIAKPIEGTRLITQTIVFITLVLLLVVLLVSVMLNRIILRKLWRPFYETIEQLKNFRLANKEAPAFSIPDIDEFRFMNNTLAEVIESANDEYKTLKEFTENASHELQTPIAIIRSKLDLVIQEEGLSSTQSEALNSVYKSIHRITKLNHSLLLLAKIENQQFESTEAINLKDKIQDKLNQFSEFWSGNEITVATKLSPAQIIANPELIEILLNNLLSNAGRHNMQGGAISILLEQGKLSVTNTGSEKELNHNKLFNRFYKESSKNQNNQSNGLGLSIVKQICVQAGIIISYTFEHSKHTFCLTWKAL